MGVDFKFILSGRCSVISICRFMVCAKVRERTQSLLLPVLFRTTLFILSSQDSKNTGVRSSGYSPKGPRALLIFLAEYFLYTVQILLFLLFYLQVH